MLCKLMQMIDDTENQIINKNTKLIINYFFSGNLPKNEKTAQLVKQAVLAVKENNSAGYDWLCQNFVEKFKEHCLSNEKAAHIPDEFLWDSILDYLTPKSESIDIVYKNTAFSLSHPYINILANNIPDMRQTKKEN